MSLWYKDGLQCSDGSFYFAAKTFKIIGEAMRHRVRAWTLAAIVPLVALLLFQAAPGQAVNIFGPFTKINETGFGDPANDFAWSMAWFKGKLYVGVSRNQLCQERATYEFYYPGTGQYITSPMPGVTCPADMYDMDLGAEIWRYDPATSAWTRVYQSPKDLDNPKAPGKKLPRDSGFRGMGVLNDTLYVGGITTREWINGTVTTASPPNLLPGPRLLKSTDGTNFEPIEFNGTVQNNWNQYGVFTEYPMGFRVVLPHQGRLFLTTSLSLTGDGPIVEFNPSTNTFTQVSPPNLRPFELESFNNQLYAGTGDDKTGYGVWRSNAVATGSSGYFSFTPILTGGAAEARISLR